MEFEKNKTMCCLTDVLYRVDRNARIIFVCYNNRSVYVYVDVYSVQREIFDINNNDNMKNQQKNDDSYFKRLFDLI